jgi:hypothetical protein
MYLEAGRDLFRGVMLLLAAAIAYWVSLTAGLALVVFVSVMTLQSVMTDWCPADLILRPLGLKKKLAAGNKGGPSTIVYCHTVTAKGPLAFNKTAYFLP